jgi:hypothetical protein
MKGSQEAYCRKSTNLPQGGKEKMKRESSCEHRVVNLFWKHANNLASYRIRTGLNCRH